MINWSFNNLLKKTIAFGIETPSDLRVRFVKSISWSLIGSVVSRGLIMLATVLLGRVLGVEGFGQFGMVQNTIGVLGQIAGSGLNLTAVKFTAENRVLDKEKTGVYISIGLLYGLVLGILGSILLYAISDWLALEVFFTETLSQTIKISSVLVFTGVINSVQTGTLVGLEEFKQVALLSIIRGFFFALFVGSGSYVFSLNGAMGGLIVAEAFTLVAGQLFLRKAIKVHYIKLNFRSITFMSSRKFWNFAFPSSIGSIVTMPAVWASNLILVNNSTNFGSLGIYNAAEKWRQIILFFPSAIYPIILPMLTNSLGSANLSQYKKVLGANLLISTLAVLVPSIGVMFFSENLMAAYGSDFASGKGVLIILCGTAFLSVINNVIGQGIVSFGLIWVRTWLDSILALLTVMFCLLLVPKYKEIGLATANLIAFGITIIFLITCFLYQYKQKRNILIKE